MKTWWFESGARYAEVNMINGKEEGLQTTWYDSGAKKQETNYVAGRIKGSVISWHENGNKSAMKIMDGGLADGLQTRWYENGEMRSKGMIKKGTGLRDGPWTEYYENGQKKSEENHLQRSRPQLGYLGEWGRVHWTSWYETGARKAEGLYIHYRPPYMRNAQGQRFANYRQGLWNDWDATGNASEGCYHQGRKRANMTRCRRPQRISDSLNEAEAFILGAARLTDDAGGFSGNPGDRAIDLGRGKGNPSVVIPNASFLNSATAKADELTISIWVKNYEVVNSSVFWAVSPSGGNSKRGFQAHVPWGNNDIVFDTAGCCNTGTQRINASIATFPGYSGDIEWWNRWHHFAFTKKGPHKEIWIDGILFLAGKNTNPLPSDFTDIWLGSNRNGDDKFMHGQLDDFAIYGTALTEAEIGKLAAGTLPTTFAAGNNLLAYWDFNETDSPELIYVVSQEVDSPDATSTVKKSDRPTSAVAYSIKRGNYWGSEIKALRNWTDAQACARTCDKDPSCVVASYHERSVGSGYGNTCVLRHAVGPWHPEQSNVHSWVRPTAKN